MVNNIGTTTEVLNTKLGTATAFSSKDNINILSGELELGFLLFDSVGTLGVISSFTNENDFIVTTYALSIDIQTILNQSY